MYHIINKLNMENETLKTSKMPMYVDRLLAVVNAFYTKTGETDLQSQIDFMEFMNNEFIKTPLFIATIASLKELQSIKRKNNNC
jgi:hypothetical protein